MGESGGAICFVISLTECCESSELELFVCRAAMHFLNGEIRDAVLRGEQMLSSVDGVFWPFICGLKWLRPGVTSTMEQVSRPSHAAGQGGKGQMWLRQSLQDHTLRSQLEILVSDPEHLHYHYQGEQMYRRTMKTSLLFACNSYYMYCEISMGVFCGA